MSSPLGSKVVRRRALGDLCGQRRVDVATGLTMSRTRSHARRSTPVRWHVGIPALGIRQPVSCQGKLHDAAVGRADGGACFEWGMDERRLVFSSSGRPTTTPPPKRSEIFEHTTLLRYFKVPTYRSCVCAFNGGAPPCREKKLASVRKLTNDKLKTSSHPHQDEARPW